MMEQLDGNIAVNAEKSQKSSLLSVEDWSAFNKELLNKKPAPLSNDGSLEFSNLFGEQKNNTGKTETMNSQESADKHRAMKKGGDKEDYMRQLKKEKAESNSSEDVDRQIKKLKAFAAGKAAAYEETKEPLNGGDKAPIEKPSTDTDGGVKSQEKVFSEPDGAVHQEGKVTKDGGVKEKFGTLELDGLTPMEGKDQKDGGVKEPLTDGNEHESLSI